MSIWVLLALSKIVNEGGDVLFELSQVHDDIILIELSVIVVLLMTGDGERETRVVELADHGPDIVSDSNHLVLNVVDLALLGSNLSLALIDFTLEVSLGFFLLLGSHGVDLGVSLELFLNVAVLLLNEIDLTVENVDIVEEGDVLLLSLDECGDDFVDGGDTSGLLDLLEGILNDLDVSGVHIHEVLLFFVVVDDLIETDLEKDGWVSEVSDSVLALGLIKVLGARFLSLVLILLLQLLLEVEDTVLEVELVHIVLGLEGKDLVLGLL